MAQSVSEDIDRIVLQCMIEAIESCAVKMAKEIHSHKRGRRKDDEWKRNPQLREIQKTTQVLHREFLGKEMQLTT
jgi:hypothetical protein